MSETEVEMPASEPVAPSRSEAMIAEVMAAVRAAVAQAPSHEEIFAAIEAMLRHVTDPPAKPDAPSEPANDPDPPHDDAA